MTTPVVSDLYATNSKQILVTRDPVYVHPAIKDGRYIGRKPYAYLPLCICIIVINPFLGILPLLFSILSSRAYRDGDVTYAKKWSGYAFLSCCIVIVFTIVIYIAIYFALAQTCTIRQYGNGNIIEECTSGISGSHSY